jgi:hypothetical protein
MKLKVLVHPVLPILNETREIVKIYNIFYEAAVSKVKGKTFIF